MDHEMQDLMTSDRDRICDTDSERNSRRKRRWLWYFLIVWTLFSLSLSVAALVTIRLNRKNSTKGEGQAELCVTCSHIEPRANTDQEMLDLYHQMTQITSDQKADQCCARTISQKKALARLLSSRLSEKSSPVKGASMLTQMTQSASKSISFAHKALKEGKAKSNKISLMSISLAEDDMYEISRGVTLRSDGIEIIYPGLYFVYESIYFEPPDTVSCHGEDITEFGSKLLCKKPHIINHTVLAATQYTCCPDCSQYKESSFNGGLFQLKKGDIIQVEADNHVHFSSDVTYMGLMLVGEEDEDTR